MENRMIYFLFTDTGTYLAKMINFCTKSTLNHVSISFDEELKEVYSFGRKRPNNPFIGGFVKEDIHSDFLKHSQCAVYRSHLTEEEYQTILQNIKAIESNQDKYRYNFVGLFGVLFKVRLYRKNAYFCSQFVATVLKDVKKFQFHKPNCFITPMDIRQNHVLQLIYYGKLKDYQSKSMIVGDIEEMENQTKRRVFLGMLTRKVRNIVMKKKSA